MTIWYILYSFGTFSPVLVSCTKKNLATLVENFKKTKNRFSRSTRGWRPIGNEPPRSPGDDLTKLQKLVE
jgi:hypothetical protein